MTGSPAPWEIARETARRSAGACYSAISRTAGSS